MTITRRWEPYRSIVHERRSFVQRPHVERAPQQQIETQVEVLICAQDPLCLERATGGLATDIRDNRGNVDIIATDALWWHG